MAPQREWFEKDYYKILGVSDSATAKEITKSYRKLARELHPDANPDDARAEERFKEVSAAYGVVGDEDKRVEYDEARKLGAGMGGFGPGGPGGAGGRAGGAQFSADDLGGLFGNLFNQAGSGPRGGPGGSRGPGPQRGADLETDLHLSFREAAHGITTGVHLTSEAACSVCHGSGARPGTSPQQCPTCSGRGFIDEDQGFFSFSQPCPSCGGRGAIVTDPCPNCGGRGIETRPREVKVRIPAGVSDSQRIRVKGRGGPGRNGGPAGDLYVRVKVDADELFGRKDRNLTITVPLTFGEAALGTKVKVPTLDGDPVTVKIPSGTPSGKTFRVKGRGIATAKGRGNLLVTVEVAVPTKLSKQERKLVEQLDALSDTSPRNHLGV